MQPTTTSTRDRPSTATGLAIRCWNVNGGFGRHGRRLGPDHYPTRSRTCPPSTRSASSRSPGRRQAWCLDALDAIGLHHVEHQILSPSPLADCEESGLVAAFRSPLTSVVLHLFPQLDAGDAWDGQPPAKGLPRDEVRVDHRAPLAVGLALWGLTLVDHQLRAAARSFGVRSLISFSQVLIGSLLSSIAAAEFMDAIVDVVHRQD